MGSFEGEAGGTSSLKREKEEGQVGIPSMGKV